MNKTIIRIFVGIIVLGGLVWVARPNGQNSNASPDGQNKDTSQITDSGSLIVEDHNKYNFGSISMAAGKVKHQFKIKNTDSEVINISKMYTSCMCTTATLIVGEKQFGPVGMPGHGIVPSLNQTINPNEEAIVEVVFDPAAHGPAGVGRIERVVKLENNAGKPIELQFAAMVTP